MADAPEALLNEICSSLSREIYKLGFLPGDVSLPDCERASFGRVKDPYSGKENLNVVLCGTDGQRRGQIQFNSDDGFFAEFDVVLQHPRDPRWFVEGVVAWGRCGDIKSEAKLLPAL